MSIDRAWVRRGLVSPAPWAQSVPAAWRESVVTFSRNEPAQDTHGGFSAPSAPPQVFLTTSAHVEFAEWEDRGTAVRSSGSLRGAPDPAQRRILRVSMPFPLDRTQLPRHGDILEWTDDLGTTYRTHVRTVESALSMGDHLEIESEAIV